MVFKARSNRFILSFLACTTVFFSSFLQANEDLEFAEKLLEKGYKTLAAKYFEKALGGKLSSKEKDSIYLELYELLNQIAGGSSDPKKKEALTKKAEGFFGMIDDVNSPRVQLKRVSSSMTTMKQASFKLNHPLEKPTPAEAKQLKSEVSKAFDLVAKVSDKIRLDARAWLTKFDEMEDERERRKLKKELERQSLLEIESSLMFGEACVIYANALGHKDPKVREWLLKMAKNYEEFIANYFGGLQSVMGSVYLGEVFVLLEKFKDDYGEVNGIERGIETFDDAIAGFQEYENDRAIEDFINNWLITANTKKATSLLTVGQTEKSIEAYKQYFEWAAIDRFSPRKEGFHDLHMNNLSQFCKLLLKLYNEGDAKKINLLANHAIAGFNYTKKVDSRWYINFQDIMGKLPTDDPNIVETTDIAFLNAEQLYNKAAGAPAKQQKDLYIQAAMKYKKALNLARLDGPKKLDEIMPEASYRMGVCFSKADNHLLALITFLEAVEKYPSDKYPEETYPEIYRNIRGCAINARASAAARNKISEQHPFDQGLYEKTLKLISMRFPEEGGDPEYFLGDLKRRAGDYVTAKREYSKIPTSSKMYYKAQYYIVDCKYKSMRERVEKQILKGEELKKEKHELIQEYEKIIQLVSGKTDKSKYPDEKVFKYVQDSKDFCKKLSFSRLASLSYEEGDFKTAHSIYAKGLDSAQNNMDRHDALEDMITCSYKLADEESLRSEIAQVEKLKNSSAYPEGVKKKTLNNAYKMLGNLVMQKKMNPMIAKKNTAPENQKKEIEAQLRPVYKELGDIFFAAIKNSVDKDEKFLKNIIELYFVSEMALENVLEAINLYFEWYPKLPELELKFRSMIGKTPEQWDAELGNIGESFNIVAYKKDYSLFLDALFDKVDYSQMRIKDIRKTKKESEDDPRNYNVAEELFNKLKENAIKDAQFKKTGLPKLEPLLQKIKNAQGYYVMLYMQADCYSRLNQYDKATAVYEKLSKYYVEQFDIRIELAKAMFAKGTSESYEQAKDIFLELSAAVAKPGSQNYNPKDFFNLQFWGTRAKLKAMGAKPPQDELIKAWQYFRSAIYQDLGYFAKEENRFDVLKIPAHQRGSHYQMIDELKAWVSENIFPVLKDSGHALASDSWEKILGAE